MDLIHRLVSQEQKIKLDLIPDRQGFFLFATVFRPALVPTHPPIK
jgi:hypothetical protein